MGVPAWTEAEQSFAREIQGTTDKDEVGVSEKIEEPPEEKVPAQSGSTDVAEVSRIAPTARISVASAHVEAP